MLNASIVRYNMALNRNIRIRHSNAVTKGQLIEEITERIGSLSTPSKMPCFGWSTPASECNIGSQMKELADKTGDNSIICGQKSCYARGGMYNFGNVIRALAKRLNAFKANPVEWAKDITELILLKNGPTGYFRWNDSGDIQGLVHLEMIVQIAKNLPFIMFWLPTREYSVLQEYARKHGGWTFIQYLKDGISFNGFPKNLKIRGSAFRFNADPPLELCKGLGIGASGAKNEGYNCPASKQNGACGDCRKCWSDEPNITYHVHIHRAFMTKEQREGSKNG